jgi:hypothetical protein
MKKVYCENCKYFKYEESESILSSGVKDCFYPIYREAYLSPKTLFYSFDADVQNENNDCEFFEERESFLKRVIRWILRLNT